MIKLLLISATIILATICSQNVNCNVIKNELEDSFPVQHDNPNDHKRYRRMVNGNDVKDADNFPYQVGLLLIEDTYLMYREGWCGGSILSHNIILTAGHCLLGTDRGVIYLGDINRKNPEPSARFLDVGSEDFIVHEKYNAEFFYNDIALIKLSVSISFSHNIKPIKLIDLENADNIDDKIVTISGWGKTSDAEYKSQDVLEFTKITILPKNECQELMNSLDDEQSSTDTSTMICANNTLNTGICKGDSGGAAIAYINGMPTQIGIASFIVKEPGFFVSTCERLLARMFTRVSSHLNWICQNSEIC